MDLLGPIHSADPVCMNQANIKVSQRNTRPHFLNVLLAGARILPRLSNLTTASAHGSEGTQKPRDRKMLYCDSCSDACKHRLHRSASTYSYNPRDLNRAVTPVEQRRSHVHSISSSINVLSNTIPRQRMRPILP